MKGTSLQLVWPNQQAQHLIRQGFEPILLCPPKLRKIEHLDRAFHFTLSSSRNDEWVILALHISLLTSRHCSLHSNTAKGCRNNSKHYLNYQVKLTTLNQLNILAHLQIYIVFSRPTFHESAVAFVSMESIKLDISP